MTSPMPADNPVEHKPYTYWQHGWDKCKQQPFVPIGAAATTVALLGATASLRSGNRQRFQTFLRLRVVAQGVTVLAMVVGAYFLTNKAEEAKEARHRALIGLPPPERPVVDDNAHLYPTRNKTKVSDFTSRLRDAEKQQALDDAAATKDKIAAAKNE